VRWTSCREFRNFYFFSTNFFIKSTFHRIIVFGIGSYFFLQQFFFFMLNFEVHWHLNHPIHQARLWLIDVLYTASYYGMGRTSHIDYYEKFRLSISMFFRNFLATKMRDSFKNIFINYDGIPFWIEQILFFFFFYSFILLLRYQP
jgi:hypothetical protein